MKRKAKAKPQAESTVLQVAVVFVFAFVLRVLFLNSNLDRDWPFSIFYYGDSAHFHEYAVDLIQGTLYDKGIPYHPPLFAWFLSVLYRIHGIPTESGFVYKLWLAAVNASTVALAWLWFRSMMPRWTAWTATAWLSLSFGWLVFSSTFNNEGLYALFLTATAALCWRNRNLLTWKSAILLGICMAAGALTRAEHIALWPFLWLYLWSCRKKDVPLLTHAWRWAASAAISLLLILPWAARNWERIDEYNHATSQLEPISRVAPITAYGPVNFALANSEQSDGGFRPDLLTRIGAQGSLNLQDPQQRHYFIHGYAEGWNWIRSHPTAALRLAMRKTDRWLDGLRPGFGSSNFPAGLNGYRPPVDIFLPNTAVLKWAFALLLVGGIALSFLQQHKEYRLCSWIVIHRLILSVVFFGYARGMAVLLPVVVPLILLPAIAIVESRFPKAGRKIQFACGIAAALLLVQAIAAASGPLRNYDASGPVDSRGKIIQDEQIEIRAK